MNKLLYGHNNEEKIVAVQHLNDNQMRVYYRLNDSITTQDYEFYPFFFLSKSSYLDGFSKKYWIKELAGSNYFRYLAAFNRWSDMWDAVHFLINQYNEQSIEKVNTYTELLILHLRTDPVSQFLLQSGRTFFKGMHFEDLHRMQIKIFTYTKSGFKYSDANRIDDRIILISLSDNRNWEYLINGKHKSEKEMLEELIHIISEKNPDVIEGHYILNFDLPYILKRCELLSLEFNIGRDGTQPRILDFRPTSTDWIGEYSTIEIPGRHLVDTSQLVHLSDLIKYHYDNQNITYAHKQNEVVKPERIKIKRERIPWYWDNEPEILKHYSSDILHDIQNISEHILPYLFYLTQIVPFSFSALTRIGSSTRIESILLREYVSQKHSIPHSTSDTQVSNEYSEIFYTGIFNNILQIDLESFYPTILLNEKIIPKGDTLNILQQTLGYLIQLQDELRREQQNIKSQTELKQNITKQISLKILTNSFYKYIGYNRSLYYDTEVINKVNLTAQNILLQIINYINTKKGKVISIDSDGIYFTLPSNVNNIKTEIRFVNNISKLLPSGTILSIGGRYKKMLSYKKNNYALITHDNKIKIKGISFISRNIEKYGRHFIEQCIEAILNDNIEGLHLLYVNLHRDISEHKLSITDFARTETLRDDFDTYTKEVNLARRHRTTCYEAAISSAINWKPGDRISFYISRSESNIKEFENYKLADEWDPNFPDEDVQYYLNRLDEFTKKFEVFFEPKDYHAIFSIDNLFAFSPKGIQILNLAIQKKIEVEEDKN